MAAPTKLAPEVKPISIPEKTKAPVIAPLRFEEPKPEKIDFFGNNDDYEDNMDDEFADLEKEFQKNEGMKKQNPLGHSITKEIL